MTAPLVVRNRSDNETPVSLLVTGAFATPEPAAQSGLRIERQAYTLGGEPVALMMSSQNARYVIVLSVREDKPLLGHLVVEDRLPAGFQIENPRLDPNPAGRVGCRGLKPAAPGAFRFRDDSFMAAFALDRTRTVKRPRRCAWPMWCGR